MVYLIVTLVAFSVITLVMAITGIVATSPGNVLKQRLAEIKAGTGMTREAEARSRRQSRRQALEGILQALGSRVTGESQRRLSYYRRLTLEAGYRGENAATIFVAIRVVAAVGAVGLALFLTSLMEASAQLRIVVIIMLGLLGWMGPFLVVRQKVRARKRDLQRGLADALDLMVVCVEAGLGVNQALLRVSEEMDRVNRQISDELTMLTLEMRAGTPREQALRNMADRCGIEDVRAWTNMMIQTDRYGTSISDSLRVHSDTLRTKRRQRAEEAAAKLTVKMLIPLVLFVFPALFVVILGPAVLAMREFLMNG
jgi:tight adherence protein C